jgi:hypothetical protein
MLIIVPLSRLYIVNMPGNVVVVESSQVIYHAVCELDN